ncbi:MAG: cytochrome C oxidase subunit IV family protein [Bacteroidales bacterium]|nr:cytochrome C oxidase subunit IV family protein [Bacteroidales bacterium]
MSEHKPHITSYKTQMIVLLCLVIFTAISVAITRFDMGPYNTAAAMLIAGIKGAIVMAWFMHLKFDNKVFMIFTILVVTVFLLVLYVTFFDYLYR